MALAESSNEAAALGFGRRERVDEMGRAVDGFDGKGRELVLGRRTCEIPRRTGRTSLIDEYAV
jgi:hypothetical protein